MTTILDISLLAVAIAIYLFMVAASKLKLKPILGSRIIVKAKAKNLIIHTGSIDHFDGDVAVCYKSDGSMFAAWGSHLFWSEGEQAFIERD